MSTYLGPFNPKRKLKENDQSNKWAIHFTRKFKSINPIRDIIFQESFFSYKLNTTKPSDFKDFLRHKLKGPQKFMEAIEVFKQAEY